MQLKKHVIERTRKAWGELILNPVLGEVSTTLRPTGAGKSIYHNNVYSKFGAVQRTRTTFCSAYEDVFFLRRTTSPTGVRTRRDREP